MTIFHPDQDGGNAQFVTHTKDNAIATITIPAVSDEFNAVDWNMAGFDAAATGKLLSVTVGGTKVFEQPVTTEGRPFPFNRAIYGAVNEAVVISLAASGTGGTSGFISVAFRSTATATTN